MSSRKKIEATPVEPVVEDPLHLKYRPRSLGELFGHDDVVGSLKSAIKDRNRQHTYFLFGPGGTGKTSIARILAHEFKCEPTNVIEVDAASTSGVDEMKLLMQSLRFKGFGESPNKAYIIDECHMLSKNAWASLLKTTEEPPEHAYFFFCSTDPTKVPAAMLTRGPTYALQPLRYNDLMDLLEMVDEAEKFGAEPWLLEIVARSCNGSPRAALVQLAMVLGSKDVEEAEALLQGVGETKEVIDLCRQMIKGGLTWADVQRSLAPLKDLGAEGIRIQVSLYLAAVLMSCKQSQAPGLLDMLNAFSKPCNPTDKLAPVMLAFGEFVNFGR